MMVVTLFLGYLGYRLTAVRTLEEYLTAKGAFPWWVLWLVMFGAQTSAFSILGCPGFNYIMGPSVIWMTIGWGVAGVAAYVFCHYPIYLLGKKYGYYSAYDLFGDRYQSKSLPVLWASCALPSGRFPPGFPGKRSTRRRSPGFLPCLESGILNHWSWYC